MEKKYIAGIVALVLVGLLAVNFVAANQFGKGLQMFKPSEEDHDAMRVAIESKDFSAWKNLMQERVAEMESQITEENFNQMVEFHQNMNQTNTRGQGMHQGMGKGMKGQGQHSGNCPYAE